MAKNRNIGLCIVFSIITCGIYALYWFVQLNNEIIELSGEEGTSGGKVLLFTIITCGIYSLFWAYKIGEKVAAVRQKRGEEASNPGVLYLVLSLIGLSIISFAMIQSEINKSVQ